jgi:hypothetical protein
MGHDRRQILDVLQTKGHIHSFLSTRRPQEYEDNLLKLHGDLLKVLLTAMKHSPSHVMTDF